MSELKVNDICIVVAVDNPTCAYTIGREVVIVKDLNIVAFNNGDIRMCYEVTDGANHYFATPPCLRKKQPPQETSSWEEIASMTGWKPSTKELLKFL